MAESRDAASASENPEDQAGIMRLLDDFLSRRAAGERLSEASLLAAHPDWADELREHLELVRHLQPGESRIDELINQGILLPGEDGAARAMLDGFQVHGMLGEGGMGVVLDGHDPQLDRHVALKVLRPDLARDSTTLARFEREARAAGGLQHPNVLTVFGVGQDRGVHYISMERVRGPSLAELIAARGRLPAPFTRQIFRQILDGLAAAHAAGLIHRDVKSSNILLDERGLVGLKITDAGRDSEASTLEADAPNCPDSASRASFVKLADFGLARMRSSQTQLTIGDSVLGTPEYMSPEQARGAVDLDHRTDLYSSGIVLYEMLTGATPFKADTPTATIRRILDEEPADPEKTVGDVDPQLAALALWLLQKQPEDRPDSAAVALNAMLTREAPTLHHFRNRSRRRQQRRGLLLMALGAVALTLGWLGWTSITLEPEIAELTFVEESNSEPSRINVQYRGAAEFQEFSAEVDSPTAATLIHPAGRSGPLVVVGLPYRLDGANLIAFDTRGERVPNWQVYLHDESRRPWPDCVAAEDGQTFVPKDWQCVALAAGNFDGRAGEELVAVAKDSEEYPSRISVIDPVSRRIRSTLWHLGEIKGVAAWPDYFEDGRDAILAWGFNNKLDGFGDPPPPPDDLTADDPAYPARFGMVPVAMVLDPADMDGLGPPWNVPPALADLPPARPVAYVFFDVPASSKATYWAADQQRYVRPDEEDGVAIHLIAPDPAISTEDQGDWMKLTLSPNPDPNLNDILATIDVDRQLGLGKVTPSSGKPIDQEITFWRARWQRIVPVAEDSGR